MFPWCMSRIGSSACAKESLGRTLGGFPRHHHHHHHHLPCQPICSFPITVGASEPCCPLLNFDGSATADNDWTDGRDWIRRSSAADSRVAERANGHGDDSRIPNRFVRLVSSEGDAPSTTRRSILLLLLDHRSPCHVRARNDFGVCKGCSPCSRRCRTGRLVLQHVSANNSDLTRFGGWIMLATDFR